MFHGYRANTAPLQERTEQRGIAVVNLARLKFFAGFHQLVAGRLDATDRARLAGLLVVDPVTGQSALPRLTRPAGRATVSRLKQHVDNPAVLDLAREVVHRRLCLDSGSDAGKR